jgi:hypothetical protein
MKCNNNTFKTLLILSFKILYTTKNYKPLKIMLLMSTLISSTLLCWWIIQPYFMQKQFSLNVLLFNSIKENKYTIINHNIIKYGFFFTNFKD